MNENEILNQNKSNNLDGEIDIIQLFKIYWKNKTLIIIVTVLFLIVAIIYAYNLPNIFRSEALVAPTSDKKDSIGGLTQLSGLASLAGVSLGGSSSVDKTAIAIETLKSRSFLIKFIEDHKLDKKMFADNSSQYSKLKVCEKLQSILSVSIDNKTKLIRIAIESESPELAKEIVTNLIEDINQNMKDKDLEEAQKSLEFLNKQINQTNIAELRNVLFQLIEDQTKTLMLVNVRSEYIFKTVDPGIVPEKFIKPKRLSICLMGAFLGIVFSVTWLFIKATFIKFVKN